MRVMAAASTPPKAPMRRWISVRRAATSIGCATSITIQNVQGSETTGGKGIEELKTDAELLLAPYARRL